jgi:hypothetical protein
MVSVTSSGAFCLFLCMISLTFSYSSCSNAKNACALTVGDAFIPRHPDIGNDSCNAEKACCGLLSRKYKYYNTAQLSTARLLHDPELC